MGITLLLPFAVTLFGIYMLFKLRFFFILHPIKAFGGFFSTLRVQENRRSLCLALAGTLGVGNIFGVAAGLLIGGEGSVFWLVISSIFASVIKYCETTLAQTAHMHSGGTAGAIERSFTHIGKSLSVLYTALCLGLSFFIGAALQTEAMRDSLLLSDSSSAWFALIMCVVLILSVLGGERKIEKITEKIIPLTTIIYISLALTVIFINHSRLGDVICDIITSAFSPEAVGGGAFGFLTSSALKEGFARGILSNEAGIGTSALAHTRAKGRAPAIAGIYGICEVIFDTVILCPLTALAVLTSVSPESFNSPMELVFHAFSASLGDAALLVVISVLLFGYSTVVCWYYYGSECSGMLFGKWGRAVFVPLYLLFIFVGAVFGGSFILQFTDTIIIFMCIITLSLLLKERRRIIFETKKAGLIL